MAHTLSRTESRNVTFLAPDFPVFWERADGCLVTDVDGNTFLDMTAAFGVASVGHGHSFVRRAVHSQTERLLHGMGDVHPSRQKVKLCRLLTRLSPIPDTRVYLAQNGSDAIEYALKTCLLATGRRGVLAFDGGYHGLGYGALDVTSRADFRVPFDAQLGHFSTRLPYGCPLEDIEHTLQTGTFGAALVEPIQGRGGINVPPPGWLAGLKEACVRHGTLLVLDEIFTGLGRTGDWFACQREGVIPDVLCVGKALGGGLPLSACLASRVVMSAWPVSHGEALHTSTFGGNPLACASARAALIVLRRERLTKRARAMGALLHSSLQALCDKYPDRARSVRGRGLMLGWELSSPAAALSLMKAALRAGLLLLPAGDGSVLEFVPPLTITPAQIAWCAAALDGLLARSPQ